MCRLTFRRLLPLYLALACAAAPVFAQNRYLEDFEFIRKTVAAKGAAVVSKKIDWKACCKLMRPEFASCQSDAQHVANVMRLLAFLRDSHTGVTRHSAKGDEIPRFAKGLYGGGLWFAWESGRFMLRGVPEGHPKAGELQAGAALVAVGDTPIWLAMERERRKIERYFGVSSPHWLFDSLSARLLPFGEAREIEITLLDAEGKSRKVKLGRWGPGGRGFSQLTVQLPDGLKYADHAIAKMLELPWSKKVGYLRVTGSMKEDTVRHFHRTFDTLRGMEALILDCRNMGGGSDGCAWEMAGRLFSKAVSNGSHGQIAPSGSWQFDGPVVMLQNENEVSSAETFT